MKSIIIFAAILKETLVLKKVISILFSIAILSVVVIPTVLVIVDDTFDASISFSVVEEEEKGGEKDLDIELLFDINIDSSDLTFKSSEYGMEYFYKRYAKPYLNIISPPPKLYII